MIEHTNRVPVDVAPNGAIREDVYNQAGELLWVQYIKRNDGAIITGTPYNKSVLDEFLIASGIAFDPTSQMINSDLLGGTAGFSLVSGTSTFTTAAQMLSFTGDGSREYVGLVQTGSDEAVPGHKVYARVLARVTNPDCTYMRFYVGGTGSSSFGTVDVQTSPAMNEWCVLGGIITLRAEDTGLLSFLYRHYYANAATAAGKVMQIDGVYGITLIDLTKRFGAGNEPDSVWCGNNIPYATNRKRTMTNLIGASDFESGATGWSFRAGSDSGITSEYAKNGIACVKVQAAPDGTYGYAQYAATRVINHIFYVSAYAMRVGDFTNTPQLDWLGTPEMFNINLGNADLPEPGVWYAVSAREMATITGSFSLRAYSHTIGVPIYLDDICLFDLTAEFGAGNEPSKEWCDTHLRDNLNTYVLPQAGVVGMPDGAVVRFRCPGAPIPPRSALSVSGFKYQLLTARKTQAKVEAPVWVTAVFDEAAQAFIIQGNVEQIRQVDDFEAVMTGKTEAGIFK